VYSAKRVQYEAGNVGTNVQLAHQEPSVTFHKLYGIIASFSENSLGQTLLF